MTSTAPSISFLDTLKAIVGEAHVLTLPEDMRPFLREWRGIYEGSALAIVCPENTDQVAAVMSLCVQYKIPLVPQGGNTGLVGGQISLDPKGIVLSLTRMNRIRQVDALSDTLVIEAGATLHQVQEAAAEVDRLFPLSLASEGSCTVGGTIATNAGGTAVLAYGTMRDLVLGLEVVLADGRIMNGLSALRKDTTGYDLKHLFIGSEGTLGIVTAASLKLFPKPKVWASAFCAVPSPQAALDAFTDIRSRTGSMLTTFELIARFGIELDLKNIPNTRDPLSQPSPWYVFLELTSPLENDVASVLEATLAGLMETGTMTDAALAVSFEQRRAFWHLRESLSEAQKPEGGCIKFDISVPISQIPAFIEKADRAVARLAPGARPLSFGHMGDGNIHYDICQPLDADKEIFQSRREEFYEAIHPIVLELGGSIAAEHGIGRLKRDWLARVKDPAAFELMRRLKNSFDPSGLLNPGCLI